MQHNCDLVSLSLEAAHVAHGMLWHGTDQVWYGMVWHGMVWSGLVWSGMVWYGMVWYGIKVVWYGMTWYGMVGYGMVWCGMCHNAYNGVTPSTLTLHLQQRTSQAPSVTVHPSLPCPHRLATARRNRPHELLQFGVSTQKHPCRALIPLRG